MSRADPSKSPAPPERPTPVLVGVPACSVEQLLAQPLVPGAPRLIDLRAPVEFEVDRVPGAVSEPLFNDAERQLVGTLYKQASPEDAYSEGVALIEAKIAQLVSAILARVGRSAPEADVLSAMEELAAGGKAALEGRMVPEVVESLEPDAFVVGCWRGGLRSQSVCALLRRLGYPAVLLDGGYRAYRQHVFAALADWTPPAGAVTLRGHTGVGKTLVLNAIERLRPNWTVDLEDLAGHRSSILGMVGREPVNQKTFESRLFARLAAGFPAGVAVFEGESRKIGDVIQPEPLWKTVRGGAAVRLTASVARRTQVLADDYLATPESVAQLRDQLPFIERRLGEVKFKGVLTGLLAEQRIDELVALLLERYYDPLYTHSEGEIPTALEVDAEDPEACAGRIVDWIEAG